MSLEFKQLRALVLVLRIHSNDRPSILIQHFANWLFYVQMSDVKILYHQFHSVSQSRTMQLK